MPQAQSQEYHKNSMKNIRAAINRYIQDLDRNVDIVHDKGFRRAYGILDGKLKGSLQKGLSRPTKHKEIITVKDIENINNFLYSVDNPVILIFCVWCNLAIDFVTRGLEFHQQLNLN